VRAKGRGWRSLTRNCAALCAAGSVWDLRQPVPVVVVKPAHAGDITCMKVLPARAAAGRSRATGSLAQMSAKGHLLATGGTDHAVMLWQLAFDERPSIRCVGRGVAHSATVNDLCFSTDNKQVRWRLRDGRCPGERRLTAAAAGVGERRRDHGGVEHLRGRGGALRPRPPPGTTRGGIGMKSICGTFLLRARARVSACVRACGRTPIWLP
jgi:hypothetical protein